MSNVIPIPEPIQREREARDSAILFAKGLRVDIAFILDGIKRRPAPPSAEMQKAIDYLKNARHWLGEELSTLGTARPYPNGDDCTTTKVDPPTDGLTMEEVTRRMNARIAKDAQEAIDKLSAECAQEHAEKTQANRKYDCGCTNVCGCPS